MLSCSWRHLLPSIPSAAIANLAGVARCAKGGGGVPLSADGSAEPAFDGL
jgi:hypothetical protein